MKKINFKIKALIYTVLFQLAMVAFYFLAVLLDPFLGIIVVGVNFFIVNTFFVYKFFLKNA